jgi:hypothetical protein
MRAAEDCGRKDFSLEKKLRSECLSGTMLLSRFCCDAVHYFAAMIVVLVGIRETKATSAAGLTDPPPKHPYFRRTHDNCRLRGVRQIIEHAQSILWRLQAC